MFRLTRPALVACAVALGFPAAGSAADNEGFSVEGSEGTQLAATPLETFNSPWAMTFLPDGRALVTEKGGALWLLGVDGAKAGQVENVPEVSARGQGGLGDVILHPDFEANNLIYLSFVERDEGDDALSGAAVARATLTLSAAGNTLDDVEVIWRQQPKVTGNGHYGHRMAFAPDGSLFITSGERQKFTPAQNMDMNLGKIVRIGDDGEVPADNPFAGQGGVTDQIWSLGHRNPLGIAFDSDGQLWAHEMGPAGGDELNRIVRAENYGYPVVSDGEHYSGEPIPDHADNPAYENPAISWTPVISPAGLVIFDGDAFEGWEAGALIGGLSSEALIRVTFTTQPEDNLGQPPKEDQTETVAEETERFSWDRRIREVELGPNGRIYVLEDREGGRLIRLEPAGS